MTLEKLCLLVVLDRHKSSHLSLHGLQLSRVIDLLAGLESKPLMQLLDFKLVLFLEFFKTQIGSRFVVAHVVVPGGRELEELRPLGTLDCHELLLLSLSHVLQLTQHLLVLQVVKLELSPPGLTEVHLIAALAPVVIEQPI